MIVLSVRSVRPMPCHVPANGNTLRQNQAQKPLSPNQTGLPRSIYSTIATCPQVSLMRLVRLSRQQRLLNTMLMVICSRSQIQINIRLNTVMMVRTTGLTKLTRLATKPNGHMTNDTTFSQSRHRTVRRRLSNVAPMNVLKVSHVQHQVNPRSQNSHTILKATLKALPIRLDAQQNMNMTLLEIVLLK